MFRGYAAFHSLGFAVLLYTYICRRMRLQLIFKQIYCIYQYLFVDFFIIISYTYWQYVFNNIA